jgi:acyl-activating enzyme 14
MARHSHGHIAQCLGGILARRGTATVAVDSGGGRRLSGAEFADGVRRLAAGLAGRGVRPGDVVAVVAFNRYVRAETRCRRHSSGADCRHH